ncbi:MAG: hypothetical protein HKN76_11395 [Saprospiraceae bacterium]|nr:hypothetical protein [Saprospiraceae bacterium]
MNSSKLWTLCRIVVFIMVILIFSPLVIPVGKADPFLLGMPYTLWMGFLVSLILLALTIIGSFVHPGRDE